MRHFRTAPPLRRGSSHLLQLVTHGCLHTWSAYALLALAPLDVLGPANSLTKWITPLWAAGVRVFLEVVVVILVVISELVT